MMDCEIHKSFLEKLQKSSNPEEDLKKENIVINFLAYTEQKRGYNRDYFIKRYDEMGAELLDNQSLESYIYRYCLYFYSDVLTEYVNIKSQLESALAYLTTEKSIAIDRRREIKRTLPDGKESDSHEYNKFGYYIDYFVDRIAAIKKELQNTNLIKRALDRAQTPYWFSWQKSMLYSTNNILDFAMVNGQDYIWFGMLPIPLMEKMRKCRKENHELYVDAFEKIIEEYSVVEDMAKICEENYYLHKRKKIIKSAAGLFKREEYEAFSCLMASQTEGMFGDYLSLCNVEFENKSGMMGKIEKVKESTPAGKGVFIEYAYFKYDFPALRNPLAHGAMVEIDKETAFELLMDAYWVVREIDSDEHDYKMMVNFLKEISSIEKGCSKILEKFRNDSMNCQSNLNLLLKWLKKDFEKVIKFYNLSENEEILRKCLDSVKLYESIWHKMPLQSEDMTQSNDGMRVMKWNDEPLKYESFIDIAQEHNFTMPENWLSGYKSYSDELKSKMTINIGKIIKDLKKQTTDRETEKERI